MNVIEPAQLKWTFPVLVVGRKNGPSDFACIIANSMRLRNYTHTPYQPSVNPLNLGEMHNVSQL